MSAPYKSWLSPFPCPGRFPHAPGSDSSFASSVVLPNPGASLSHSLEKHDAWNDEDAKPEKELKKIARMRSRPLFDRAALEESPPSSPAISDMVSDDDDLESPVPLLHSNSTSHTSPIGATGYFVFDDYYATGNPDEETPSSPDRERTSSSTTSLVPTVIGSRPPSPRPHSCIAEAEALGIKVRDFAYEEHGVPPARPVPDIETLKARYQLYRSAELTPPADVVDTLRDYDEMWLTEKEQFFDDKQRISASTPADSTILPVTAQRRLGIPKSVEADRNSPVYESCVVKDSAGPQDCGS